MTTAPIVATALGRARGSRLDSGVEAYLGLPYGQPTDAERRFAPPLPVDGWGPGELDATACGAPPPQFPHDREHLYPQASEDCLWLNVWTPASDRGARPVMVWIHGGGWVEESACDPIYLGDALAERGDVVVVAVEYRSNIFGFGHIRSVPGSGNAGILDQALALAWVRDHIGAFGGDPQNVTIFGESAGGMSVSALLGLPQVRGLFHQAIMQSNVASTIRRPDFADAVTAEIARRALGGTASEPNPAALRQLAWPTLLESAVSAANDSGLSPDVLFGPVHDGVVFADTPMRATANGLNTDVPILLGVTRDESRYWYDLEPLLAMPGITEDLILEAMVASALPTNATIADIVTILSSVEPDMTPLHRGLAGLDDVFFRQPVARQAEAHARAAAASTYVYRFDYEPAVPRANDFDYGSPHAAELGFTLGTAAVYPEMYGDRWPQRLVDQMMDTWIAFARTGDPNHAGLPRWPTYDLAARPTMVFDADDERVTTAVHHDPDPERRVFWQSVPFDGTHPAFAPHDLEFEA